MDGDRRVREDERVNDEVDALWAELEALTTRRRGLEDAGLQDTPEYRHVAAEWDRVRTAHYQARCRAGDHSDKFTAEMECVGFSPVTEEDILDLDEERELAAATAREIHGDEY
jgi:hypothetical protein